MAQDDLGPITYRFHEFELDERLFQLRRAGKPLPVARQVFDLVHYLVRHRDRPVTKDELLDTIWEGRFVGEESISRCVATARKFLGDGGRTQHTIKTIHGRGYWFIAPVEAVSSAAAALVRSSADREPLVGREAELRLIHRIGSLARGGTGGLVTISGEAGIGKSRLLNESVAVLGELGFECLVGRSVEGPEPPPASPWGPILRRAVHAVKQLAPTGSTARFDAVYYLLPEEDSPDDRYNDGARHRAFEACCELFSELSISSPVLIAMDDLHRTDALSLDLLRFVASETTRSAIAIVAAYRDGVAGEDRQSAIRSMEGMSSSSHLRLQPLSEAEAVSMLCQNEGLESEVARLVFERSSGNPLLISILTQLVRSTRTIDHTPTALPRGMRAAILTLVSSLPDRTRSLLSMAAVAGREFDVDLLSSVLATSPGDVVAGLTPAIDAQIVQDVGCPDGFAFRHTLLRDALYAEIPPEKRIADHKLVAEALQRRHPAGPSEFSSELAHHFDRALVLVGPNPAMRHLREAGRWAANRLGFREAADFLERALEISSRYGGFEGGIRTDLLTELGAYRLRGGLRAEARDAFRAAADGAEELVDARRLARVALELAPDFFAIETGVTDAFLVSTLERAVSLLTERTPQRVRLLVQLGIALYWSGESSTREALIDEAEALAGDLSDRTSRAYALMGRFAALWAPESHRFRLGASRDLVRLADAAGEHSLALMARVFRLTTLLEAGDVRAFDREVTELDELASAFRNPHAKWYPMLYRTMRCLMEGDFRSAEKHGGEFVELGVRLADVNAIQSFALLAAETRWEQGLVEDVLSAAEQFASRFESLPGWKAVVCLLRLELNQVPEAKEIFENLAMREFSTLRRDTTWLGAISVLAHVCVKLRDTERAGTLLRLLEPYRANHVVVGFGTLYFGTVALRLGMLSGVLGDHEAADGYLCQAIRMSADVGADVWSARSRLERFRWGPPADVEERLGDLRDARGAARRLQLGLLEREVAKELANFREPQGVVE